jgi:hypothetical protein
VTPARRRARLAAALALPGLLLLTSSAMPRARSVASGPRTAGGAAAHAAAGASAATAKKVAPLRKRVRPDVLVVAARPLPAPTVARLRKLSPAGFTTFSAGHVRFGGKPLGVAGVDPSTFRTFAPAGTAEATPVWTAVAAGDLAVAHDVAKAHRVALGSTTKVVGRTTLPLRVAALATTGLPDTGLVVSAPVAKALGVPAANAALLTAGTKDPAALAAAARRVVGPGVTIHLLTQPATPYAFLTGSSAARAFGAFSYRWYDDGTIEPDARWVAANIVNATVPILGRVTCHRLMVPQLRHALADVQAAGLASLIHSYNGCYVPRFIERDPTHAVSLHTWGIAIDLDSLSNQRGGRGTMDQRVVDIFKRWGFRWGGDWSYTDPMHFEIGALITGLR